MEHFVEHCESVHQLKPKTLTTDGIQFELRKPLDSPSGRFLAIYNQNVITLLFCDNIGLIFSKLPFKRFRAPKFDNSIHI